MSTTTEEKCVAIVKRMLELANESKPVTIEEDWGGHSATVKVGNAHTHVGWTDVTFDAYVESLYNALHGGPGLSFVKDSHDSAV